MSARMAIEIRCDCADDGCVVVGERHCPELIGLYARDNLTARLEARRDGWSTKSTGRTVRDYCPTCAKHRAVEADRLLRINAARAAWELPRSTTCATWLEDWR